jgi:hypothetical protein
MKINFLLRLLSVSLIINSCSIFKKNNRQYIPTANTGCKPIDNPSGNPLFTTDTTTITKDPQNPIVITTDLTTTKNNPTYQQTINDQRTNTEDGFDCTTTTVSINATSSTFMNADYAAQGQFIYPGAIYDYNDFVNGRYNEVAINRNPIELTTDNPNTKPPTSEIICKPQMSTIREGIANLYSRFSSEQTGTMNLRYQTYESKSKAELSMRLSAGASYAGFSIENEYSNKANDTRHFVTIDVIKPLYTINTILPYTKTYLTQDMPNLKNPVIISSVTYGIRVLANFNLNTSTKEELEKFKAKYNGIATTAKIDFEYLSKNENTDQTINCYVVGGPGNSTVAFDKSELEQSIQKIVAGVTYATARPISFTLRDLQGHIIETRSAADNIITTTCVPHVDPPVLQDVLVKIRTGNNDKDHDTHYRVFLRKGIDGSTNEYGDCALDNQRDIRYPDNISTTESMQNVNRSITKSDFINSNGGSILLFINGGNDTWNIASFAIVLLFKDGTQKKIDYDGFDISEQQKMLFFFNRNFEKL